MSQLDDFLHNTRRGYSTAGTTALGRGMEPLLEQLRLQSQGQGPFMAEEQYRRANSQAMRNQLALSRGRNPGIARQAGVNMASLDAGMAQGLTQAGIQERMQAGSQLMQGTGMQQQNELARNQQYLAALLSQPSAWERFMQLTSAGAAVLGAR